MKISNLFVFQHESKFVPIYIENNVIFSATDPENTIAKDEIIQPLLLVSPFFISETGSQIIMLYLSSPAKDTPQLALFQINLQNKLVNLTAIPEDLYNTEIIQIDYLSALNLDLFPISDHKKEEFINMIFNQKHIFSPKFIFEMQKLTALLPLTHIELSDIQILLDIDMRTLLAYAKEDIYINYLIKTENFATAYIKTGNFDYNSSFNTETDYDQLPKELIKQLGIIESGDPVIRNQISIPFHPPRLSDVEYLAFSNKIFYPCFNIETIFEIIQNNDLGLFCFAMFHGNDDIYHGIFFDLFWENKLIREKIVKYILATKNILFVQCLIDFFFGLYNGIREIDQEQYDIILYAAVKLGDVAYLGHIFELLPEQDFVYHDIPEIFFSALTSQNPDMVNFVIDTYEIDIKDQFNNYEVLDEDGNTTINTRRIVQLILDKNLLGLNMILVIFDSDFYTNDTSHDEKIQYLLAAFQTGKTEVIEFFTSKFTYKNKYYWDLRYQIIERLCISGNLTSLLHYCKLYKFDLARDITDTAKINAILSGSYDLVSYLLSLNLIPDELSYQKFSERYYGFIEYEYYDIFANPTISEVKCTIIAIYSNNLEVFKLLQRTKNLKYYGPKMDFPNTQLEHKCIIYNKTVVLDYFIKHEYQKKPIEYRDINMINVTTTNYWDQLIPLHIQIPIVARRAINYWNLPPQIFVAKIRLFVSAEPDSITILIPFLNEHFITFDQFINSLFRVNPLDRVNSVYDHRDMILDTKSLAFFFLEYNEYDKIVEIDDYIEHFFQFLQEHIFGEHFIRLTDKINFLLQIATEENKLEFVPAMFNFIKYFLDNIKTAKYKGGNFHRFKELMQTLTKIESEVLYSLILYAEIEDNYDVINAMLPYLTEDLLMDFVIEKQDSNLLSVMEEYYINIHFNESHVNLIFATKNDYLINYLITKYNLESELNLDHQLELVEIRHKLNEENK